MMRSGADISAAICARAAQGAPALIAYLTAGFPTRETFQSALAQVLDVADVVEVGVPFSDPMADGLTIQHSSRVALEQGTTLGWTLDVIQSCRQVGAVPLLLMSYLNPLLSYGMDRLAVDAAEAGVSGLIVPDLPFEECIEVRPPLDAAGLGLVQMVTPVTPPARLALLADESRGFVYAVTQTGITGQAVAADGELIGYLRRVREAAALPVCAGFGIRSADQVRALAGHADGCIVGSALIEALKDGRDVAGFLQGLKS